MQFTFFLFCFVSGRDNPTAGGLSANGNPTKASPATLSGSPLLFLPVDSCIPPKKRVRPTEVGLMKNAQTTPKQVQPYAISVDWLQVYCFVDNPNIEEFTPLFSSQFDIVKLPHGTRQFKNVYEIYTVDREEDNPKNTVYNPIKHNGNYKK